MDSYKEPIIINGPRHRFNSHVEPALITPCIMDHLRWKTKCSNSNGWSLKTGFTVLAKIYFVHKKEASQFHGTWNSKLLSIFCFCTLFNTAFITKICSQRIATKTNNKSHPWKWTKWYCLRYLISHSLTYITEKFLLTLNGSQIVKQITGMASLGFL